MASARITAIIVLNWNRRNDTLACLGSIASTHVRDAQVILVDNGSCDGSVEAVSSEFPEVQIIQTGKNLGFVGGNNVGITHALNSGAEYIFLLNNDTIVGPSFLEPIVECASADRTIGIVGPKIYQYGTANCIWFAGAYFDHYGTLCHEQFGQYDTSPDSEYKTSVYIPGCGLFIKREVLDQIGLLDQDFFSLFEDVDWCIKARKSGYSSVLVPQSIIWHKEAQTFGGKESPAYLYYFARNQFLIVRRHKSGKQRTRLYCSRLRSSFTKWNYYRNTRTLSGQVRSKAVAIGVMDFWRGRLGQRSYEWLKNV